MSFSSLNKTMAPALAFGVAFVALSRAEDGPSTLVEEFVGPEDLIVSGSVNLGVTFTDNRDRINESTERRAYEEKVAAGVRNPTPPRSKVHQTAFHVGPQLTMEKEVLGRMDFRLSYSPVFTWWDEVKDGSDEFRVNHKLDARLFYELSPRTEIEFGDNFWWSGQRDIYYSEDHVWDPENENNLSNDDYFVNVARAGLRRYLGNEDWVKLSGRYHVKRYDDDEKARYSDEDEWKVRLDYMHEFSRRLSLGLLLQYTDWDRRSELTEKQLVQIGQSSGEYAPNLDLGARYLELGVQGEYDFSGHKNTLLYGSTGWAHFWYEDEDTDDRDFWGESKLELRLFQQHDTQLFFGGRYGHVSSETYPFSSQEDIAGYACVKQYLGKDRRLSASATVELRRRTYRLKDDMSEQAKKEGYRERLLEQTGGKDEYDRDTLYVQAALNYRFTKWFSANVNYTYHDVDAEVGTDYKENVFGINGNVKFF